MTNFSSELFQLGVALASAQRPRPINGPGLDEILQSDLWADEQLEQREQPQRRGDRQEINNPDGPRAYLPRR